MLSVNTRAATAFLILSLNSPFLSMFCYLWLWLRLKLWVSHNNSLQGKKHFLFSAQPEHCFQATGGLDNPPLYFYNGLCIVCYLTAVVFAQNAFCNPYHVLNAGSVAGTPRMLHQFILHKAASFLTLLVFLQCVAQYEKMCFPSHTPQAFGVTAAVAV